MRNWLNQTSIVLSYLTTSDVHIRIFSVPNGCSTVSRRVRIASGFFSRRACMFPSCDLTSPLRLAPDTIYFTTKQFQYVLNFEESHRRPPRRELSPLPFCHPAPERCRRGTAAIGAPGFHQKGASGTKAPVFASVGIKLSEGWNKLSISFAWTACRIWGRVEYPRKASHDLIERHANV